MTKEWYIGIAPQTTMGTSVHSELWERHMKDMEDWDGTMPETEEEELERLRLENATLREIVQAVAVYEFTYCGPWYSCVFCKVEDRLIVDIEHTPTCPVTRARDQMGKSAEEVQ